MRRYAFGHPPRLSSWDYRVASAYFVTFKVYDRSRCLALVRPPGLVELRPEGEVVVRCWLSLPDTFGRLQLDALVVMPDHVHAVLFLGEEDSRESLMNQGPTGMNQGPTGMNQGPTGWRPLMGLSGEHLGKVVRHWKARACRIIRKEIDPGFGWQSHYWDRVIRSPAELHRIRRYILLNPARWLQQKG